MQFIFNIFLYLIQKRVIKIGGEVRYNRDVIELYAPKGKHWNVPTKYTINEFRGAATDGHN